MKEYYLENDDLMKIWMGFLKMDVKNRGHVNLNHLMVYIQEQKYSVVSPFLERFFKLVDKADPNVVTFDEFLPACCAFALFTRPEMIAFIFNMLDLDQDKILSKVDLLQFAQQVRIEDDFTIIGERY